MFNFLLSNFYFVNDKWNKSYMNCGNEMKMKKWSSQWTQFMQLREEDWKKFRTSTGFEPVTSRLPVQCSTNWAMKPLTLGADQLWVHMFPWKKWLLMISLFHMSSTLITYNSEKKKFLHRHMPRKKFLTPEVLEKNSCPITSPIPRHKSVGQPLRGKKRIWHLSKWHPSTKWLARVHHVVVFKTKVLRF